VLNSKREDQRNRRYNIE